MGTKKSPNSSVLTAAKVQVQDYWINWYRAAMGLLTAMLIGIVSYMGSGALKNQADMLANQSEMTAQIATMNERGTRNREDIGEIKGDLKDTQAKVETIGEAVIRLELTAAR